MSYRLSDYLLSSIPLRGETRLVNCTNGKCWLLNEPIDYLEQLFEQYPGEEFISFTDQDVIHQFNETIL